MYGNRRGKPRFWVTFASLNKGREGPGRALYEVKPLSSAPQLDFAVWLLDVGTFGIQTKGGRYIIIDGEWYQVTDRGRIRKESPIPGTWDAAMAIHDVVQEHLRHKTFVIPVLVLTDMEPDAEIEALAAARNVAVHWGSPDNLVEHLVELAAERKVYVRPTSAGIAAEKGFDPGPTGQRPWPPDNDMQLITFILGQVHSVSLRRHSPHLRTLIKNASIIQFIKLVKNNWMDY